MNNRLIYFYISNNVQSLYVFDYPSYWDQMGPYAVIYKVTVTNKCELEPRDTLSWF
nr:MAG TPA: hypothetical protein [Caudoviricetes sp.]